MQQREEILIKVKDDLEAYDSENKKFKKKDKEKKDPTKKFISIADLVSLSAGGDDALQNLIETTIKNKRKNSDNP